ncbi:hypothetical protein B0H16DRAFT_655466 [Mycena metata]|uniref:Uncharacterized protein n=1 Tax=Mycena metata TaxID=1033252 RepID=A0AAD7MBE7_9AGAR|nr:hypothetical protein B0H16DRAFT_655466 [Mycena metata]
MLKSAYTCIYLFRYATARRTCPRTRSSQPACPQISLLCGKSGRFALGILPQMYAAHRYFRSSPCAQTRNPAPTRAVHIWLCLVVGRGYREPLTHAL